MRRRGKATASATALAAGALTIATACGGSPTADPSSPTPLSSSPTTTATSTSATPTASSTLDPNSDAAVIAAVRAYVTGFQSAVRSGSLQPYAAVTTADCNCRQQVSSIVAQLAEAHETTNVSFSLSAVRITSRVSQRAEATFTLTNRAYEVLDHNSKAVQTGPAATNTFDVSFTLQGDRWLAYLTT